IAMGRKAGHLALGIGSPAGATLTVIPEERREEKMDLNWLVDTLVGAIIKRISVGRDYGVAVLAEGLAEKLDEAQLAAMGQLEYDEHGHPRLSEIDFGRVVKTRVRQELAKLGIKMTIVDKDIGYELRCADPTSFEMEYVKELGFSAAKHALMGGSGDMVSIQDGVFVPIPFYAIMDPSTGRTKVRMMDIHSEAYEMALEYMIRLKKEDFENEETVKKLAACANLDPEQFRQRFEKVAVKFEGSSVVIPYQQPKA
ncbi:MAG: 6-phosphofructokinase, partial [Nitrospinota bacterium]|nr:6-phosphofructokinase [Nitrospinota bacterium]